MRDLRYIEQMQDYKCCNGVSIKWVMDSSYKILEIL